MFKYPQDFGGTRFISTPAFLYVQSLQKFIDVLACKIELMHSLNFEIVLNYADKLNNDIIFDDIIL